MENKRFAIIVAGGIGSRMKAELPKQFLKLGVSTILEITITKFLKNNLQLKVVVVIPEAHQKLWNGLSDNITQNERVQFCFGGKTRYHSVTNGLKELNAQPNDLVAIHDAVRPLLSNDLIERCFLEAEKIGNAIPCTEVVETLRELKASDSKWVNRSNYRAIQTPQTFQFKVLKDAYSQPFSGLFTDDASVVESLGTKVNLITGERNNIKITTQEDLALAQLLIQQ